MLASIVSTYRLLPQAFRPRFLVLVLLSILAGLIELVGVASIMPLVAAMVDAQSAMQNRVLGSLLSAIGLNAPPPLHWAGIATILLFVSASAASAAISWWTIRFSAHLTVALSSALATATFRKPFSFFLASSPAKLAHQMCNEVPTAATSGVLQLCIVIVKAVQLLLVLALLLAVAPLATLALALATAALYLVIYRLSSVRIARWGSRAAESAADAAHRAAEMYATAREILLRRDGSYFVERVTRSLTTFALADARSRFWPATPKYALETFVVALLFSVPIYRSLKGQDARAELPLLVTFAYAGFRLLPSVQQIYASLAILRFHQPAIERLGDVLAAPEPAVAASALTAMPATIELRALSFTYPGRAEPALRDASLSLTKGERIAIVGPSGAGKSTLVDLLLGLLTPTCGRILVDGRETVPPMLAWRAGAVGYVPQAPLLVSDTIARNIALDVAGARPDPDRCREAATRASILELIERLPGRFDAVIGRDIQSLSGGERQRLAIARALYSQPSLLVLDEPASGLDPPATRRLFEMLCEPAIGATVVVITHDIDHLRLFNRVVFVEDGGVVTAGTADSLAGSSPGFAAFLGSAGGRRRANHDAQHLLDTDPHA